MAKKRKLKSKKIFIMLILLSLLIVFIFYVYSLRLTSITVKGNTLYSNWDIIKLAKLDNYPNSMQSLSGLVSHRLEKDNFIKRAYVKKTSLTSLEITVEENMPLFYYAPNNKTVLANEKEVKENFAVPTLINYVPNELYAKFVKEMANVDYTVIKRMSEIKYDPNDVDQERFLITMNDGNYVYLTLSKFNKINHYVNIIKEFDNKKGVLYLDSGEYFKAN